MPASRLHPLATRISQLALLALAVSCVGYGPGCSNCPDAKDVERTWRLSTTCAGGGEARVRVTDVSETEQDCPSGCIYTQHGRLVQLEGTLQTEGTFRSNCGRDPGMLQVQLPGPMETVTVSCDLHLSRLGEDQSCVHEGQEVCTARVAPAD